jgi:hypothetical protein
VRMVFATVTMGAVGAGVAAAAVDCQLRLRGRGGGRRSGYTRGQARGRGWVSAAASRGGRSGLPCVAAAACFCCVCLFDGAGIAGHHPDDTVAAYVDSSGIAVSTTLVLVHWHPL